MGFDTIEINLVMIQLSENIRQAGAELVWAQVYKELNSFWSNLFIYSTYNR